MDLYQGSLPRKFIRFRLGSQPMDEQTPNLLGESNVVIGSQPSGPAGANDVTSPTQENQPRENQSGYISDDTSNGDVTEYASQMVEHLEQQLVSDNQDKMHLV